MSLRDLRKLFGLDAVPANGGGRVIKVGTAMKSGVDEATRPVNLVGTRPEIQQLRYHTERGSCFGRDLDVSKPFMNKYNTNLPNMRHNGHASMARMRESSLKRHVSWTPLGYLYTAACPVHLSTEP